MDELVSMGVDKKSSRAGQQLFIFALSLGTHSTLYKCYYVTILYPVAMQLQTR